MVKDAAQNESQYEFELFDKLDIGAMIFDYPRREVIFANRYCKTLAGGNQSLIADNVFSHLDSKKRLSVRSDMKLGRNTVIGYTVYNLTQSRFLALLNDISYKKIYLENREENYFYDKLSYLMAEVVHEIGNPLTSVTTTLQVLNQYIETWDSPKKREYLQRSVNEIQRLSKYLKKIREFSAANDRIDKKSVYLLPVIQKVVTQNKAFLDTKKISVYYGVEQTTRVMVDEDVFYQVLLNLFLNSFHILSQHGNIWISVEEINEFYVKLIYANDGPPIPAEIMKKIFMPFFTTKKEGTGIGLALSLKLMTRMGGKMEAETPENGQGTRFILYVPVAS